MKNALVAVKKSLMGFGGKASLEFQKRSPEIYLGLGLIGIVGTVVLACRATLKAEEILDRHQDRMEKAKEAAEVADPEEFDLDREKTVVWAHTLVDFTKLYAPCAALGAVSVAFILKSHNTLSNRYIGAVSAFNGVKEAFDAYRNRVIEEEGEEKDRHYRYGTTLETREVTEVDENGNEVTKTETREIIDHPLKPGEFARYFDESNDNWDENPDFNLRFLRGVEHMANDILQTRTWICLNEVYEMLGFKPTPSGQINGWAKENGSFVDFGLGRGITDPDVRRFINGQENVILLEFNVDGVILDKIGSRKIA